MFSRGMTAIFKKKGDTTYGPLWRFMWKIMPGTYIIEQIYYRFFNDRRFYSYDDMESSLTKVIVKDM